MGASKKKPRRPVKADTTAVATSADFTVVLEDLRGKFAVFGEALQGLGERMDRGFEQVDRRFEQVDRRFEQVDRRFERIESDVGLLKTAVVDNARETKALRDSVADNARETKALRETVDDLSAKIGEKPGRDEVAALVRQIATERAH